MNQAHSIKVVAPLVSGDLLRYAMCIPADLKLKPRDGDPQETSVMEKWILRKAFEADLPAEITWRGKQEFSQGSGSAALLAGFFEDEIDDAELESARGEFPFLRSKEELHYFRLFTDHFGRGCAVETVGLWPH
jgi:asparagine synthase (glutamine-hydrolysing)